MGYPKVEFIYTSMDGRKTTFSKEIRPCCAQCETEKIFDAFQSWANEIGDEISEKYPDEDDDETPNVTPLNGYRDFDDCGEE